jgi:hypothetical protein
MNRSQQGLCALLVIGLGCGGGSSSASKGPSYGASARDGGLNLSPGADNGAYGGTSGSKPMVGAGGSTAATLPPEQETQLDFLAPRGGGRYVYVANPARDLIAVIDSKTLAIEEVTAGDTPTYLTTIPGQDVALVINTGSNSLNILRGTKVSPQLPIVTGANSIAVSPDGLHAVAWFDSSQPGPSGVVGSYQDVSVISLSAVKDTVVSMTVGFQPSAVVFSNDNAAAFVITSDGISTLRFANITTPARAPLIRIENVTVARPDAGAADSVTVEMRDSGVGMAQEDVGPPADGEAPADGGAINDGGRSVDSRIFTDTRILSPDTKIAQPDLALAVAPVTGSGKPVDVSVTRDGRYAIARRDGRAELLLVDLAAGTVTATSLSSPVTDLDLKDTEGTPPQAFAVLRNESKLVRLDIPAGFSDSARQTPWPFPDETIGSVSISKRGQYALLYTTAVPSKRLVIFDMGNSTAISSDIRKGIRAVAFADDEKTALVLHTKVDGSPTASGIDFETKLDRSYGYSLVNLKDGFAKLEITAVKPDPFTITPDSKMAFVLLRDDAAGVRTAQRIALDSFLVDDFMLGSPPNSIAALAIDTRKVFIGQIHPEGRITFIDWIDGTMQSVTGFDLNGRIRQ